MIKYVFFVLFNTLFLLTLNAQFIDWEDEIVVAPNNFGNVRPRIVLTNNEEPLVLFGKSSLGLFVSKFENNVFNDPVMIHPSDVSVYMTNWTSADLSSHGDSVAVIFKSNPLETGPIYFVRSVDGGLSFSDTIRADTHLAGVAWLPCLQMNNDGNPIISYMAHDPIWSNPRYVYSKSNNLGESFSNEIDITTGIGEEACDCCPAELVVDGNKEVLLFRNVNQNIRDIYAVYSSDSGSSFQYSVNTENLNWFVNSCPSTAPDGIFIGDRLWSVAASRASGKYRVYLSESLTNDSIQSLLTDSIFPPNNFNGSQNYPRISSDGETAVLVWQESNPSNYDIFLSYTMSGNFQEMLGQKIMVNMDPSGAQLNPDVVVKNGFVHVVFQDNNGGVVKYRRGKFTSLEINDFGNGLKLFPNPSSEILKLEGLMPFFNDYLKIYNANGELFYQQIVASDNIEVDLSNFNSGIYTLTVNNKTTQFIVQKN